MRQAAGGNVGGCGSPGDGCEGAGGWGLVPGPRQVPHPCSESCQICLTLTSVPGEQRCSGGGGEHNLPEWPTGYKATASTDQVGTLGLASISGPAQPLHFVLSSAASIPALSFLWTRPQKTHPRKCLVGRGLLTWGRAPWPAWELTSTPIPTLRKYNYHP